MTLYTRNIILTDDFIFTNIITKKAVLMNKNRRKHFLINKPFQFRYMLFVTAPLLIICTIALLSFYIGIWGSVLDVFSDAQLRKDLLTASRMVQYEERRLTIFHRSKGLAHQWAELHLQR